MAIRTRLTEELGIGAPIFSAPMGFTAGGKLAAAVSRAGGFGFLGAGVGDTAWIDREFAAADGAGLAAALLPGGWHGRWRDSIWRCRMHRPR